MFLIDALYISSSGGLRLLEYLTHILSGKGILFYLLADSRCDGFFNNYSNVEYLDASLKGRSIWYRNQDFSKFSSVLCFGNIPAPIKLNIPVYTYFHNINLLTLNGLPSKKETIKGWLKRVVYKHYKNNTDFWLVQTNNTKHELIKHLVEGEERVLLMPFFNIPEQLEKMASQPHGEDYVYIANYTGSKQHEVLLDAWCLLHKRKINKTLHLTVPDSATVFLNKVGSAKEQGVNVINHGFVPFEEVIKLYSQAKAIVYPSLNESLGLGIVEAITAGCDVIGSDLPYTHSICHPSVSFNPYSALSIANAIVEYEKGDAPKSKLLIRNQIDDLLTLLSK